MTEYGLFNVGPWLMLDGFVLFGPPVWCPREEARRILVSSSGTHSVRSDRVPPDVLQTCMSSRFTEILFIAVEVSRLLGSFDRRCAVVVVGVGACC